MKCSVIRDLIERNRTKKHHEPKKQRMRDEYTFKAKTRHSFSLLDALWHHDDPLFSATDV